MKQIEHVVVVKVPLQFVGTGKNVQDALDNALALCRGATAGISSYDLRKGPKVTHHSIREIDVPVNDRDNR
jgi:hypothetical protein